jgi:O-antigen/teichoic acid export membrane protein
LSLLIILYKNKILLKDFSFQLFKKSLSYGLPLMGLEFLNHILTYADRYFINYYIGSERLGIYTVAYNLTSYLTNILLLPISLAIMPVLLESWSKKGPDETKLFLSKSLQYTLLLVFPVIVGFIIIRYDLIILLASSKYLESQRIIPFITLGVSFYILSNIFNAGLIIFKKTKIIMIFAGIASLINIGLNMILIPRFDLMGAAYATAISYFCFLIFIIISGWFYLSFKIKYMEITLYFIFSIVMAIIVNNIIFISPILSLSVKILVGIFIYSSLVLIFDRNTRILVLKYFSK